MNKKILIFAGILILIIAGGLFFLVPKNSPVNNNSAVDQSSNSSAVQNMFMQAFAGNDSLKCTFSGESGSGTAYIKQGKIKFDSSAASGPINHAVIDGKIVYVWEEGSVEGMKIDTSAYTQSGTGQKVMDADNIKSQIEQNKPNCVKENIDDLQFAVPGNVKFADISEIMKTTNPTGGTLDYGSMNSSDQQKLIDQYSQ